MFLNKIKLFTYYLSNIFSYNDVKSEEVKIISGIKVTDGDTIKINKKN